MGNVAALAPYVPLFQTIVWVLVLVVAAKVFYPQLVSTLEAINTRINSGSSLTLGMLKLGEDLRLLAPI